MKRFGFHPNQLYHHWRNPTKVKYISHKTYGDIEFPSNKKTTHIKELAANYRKRLDFEKYMNPNGIKTTVTSRFK